ncbi:MAG: hypothetical protein AAGE52_33480 [Myxococcota bacterium]
MMQKYVIGALLIALGCGDDSAAVDASVDTGRSPDAGTEDSGAVDAGSDSAMPDVGIDAGFDAGPIGSAGCVDGASLPEGENGMDVEGRARRFMVRLPEGYSRDRAWPLVFALHGNGGNPGYWDGTSGDRNIREVLRNDAVLIIPEAIDNAWRNYDLEREAWGPLMEEELVFFDELITLATDELCIDEDEIFAMGFSGGGSFSGVLGCRRTDIRAIAAGGSVIYFDEADCVHTPAAWITIGTEELQPGREAYRDFFRDRAGCDASSMPTDPDPCIAYDGCGESTPVHYCQHPGGHRWPDFGSQAMWDFLSTFVD